MRIRGITVCVDFSHLLARGLPRWKNGLERLVVVTSSADKETQELCRKFGVETYVTDIFYANGAKFNKGAALAAAVHELRWREGAEWLLSFDADIVPPAAWKAEIEACKPSPGSIYGARRWQVPENAPWTLPGPANLIKQDCNASGFFVLFHNSDPLLPTIEEPLFEMCWPTAAVYDTNFIERWRCCNRESQLPLKLIHLGANRRDWLGYRNDAEMAAFLKLGLSGWHKGNMPNPPLLPRLPRPVGGPRVFNLITYILGEHGISRPRTYTRLGEITEYLDLQVANSVRCGWQPEDLQIRTNFDYVNSSYGVRSVYLDAPSRTFAKWLGVRAVLQNCGDADVVWSHDHDGWQLNPFTDMAVDKLRMRQFDYGPNGLILSSGSFFCSVRALPLIRDFIAYWEKIKAGCDVLNDEKLLLAFLQEKPEYRQAVATTLPLKYCYDHTTEYTRGALNPADLPLDYFHSRLPIRSDDLQRFASAGFKQLISARRNTVKPELTPQPATVKQAAPLFVVQPPIPLNTGGKKNAKTLVMSPVYGYGARLPREVDWMLKSAARHGIHVHLVYCGENRMSNYTGKILKTFEQVRNLPGYDHIILVDAFDSVFAAGLAEMHQRFDEIGADFVLSGEVANYPWPKRYAEHPLKAERFGCVNSGFYMARFEAWRAVLQYIIQLPDDGYKEGKIGPRTSDQAGFWHAWLAGVPGVKIAVDTGCRLSQPMGFTDPHEVEWTLPRPRNTVTGSHPCVFHFDGRSRYLMRSKYEFLTSVPVSGLTGRLAHVG